MGTERKDKFRGLLDKAAGWIVCLLPLICMMIPGVSWADVPTPGGADMGGGFFTVPGNDKSVLDFLRPVFGSLFGGNAGGPMENTLSVINAGALVLGGMLAAYVIAIGTMQTAHEGEMLGKHWSSVWVPIRHSLGVALVVPVGSGYCVAQMFIAWCTLQGVGFADAVWEKFVDSYMDPSSMSPRIAIPNVSNLAMSVLKQQYCMELFNAERRLGQSAEIYGLDMKTTSSSDGKIHKYGGGYVSEAACGMTKYDPSDNKKFEDATKSGILNGQAFYTDIATTGMDMAQMNDQMQSAHLTALSRLESDMSVLAKDMVAAKTNGGTVDIAGRLKLAQDTYQNGVVQFAGGLISGNNLEAFKAAAKQDGWVMAGAWFMRAVQMQDAMNRIVSQVPVAIEPDPKMLANMINDKAAGFAGGLEYLDARLRESTQTGIEQSAATENGAVASTWQEITKEITEKIFKGLDPMTTLSGSTRAPVMAIKDFGDMLIWGGEAGLLVSIKLTAGQGVKAVIGALVLAVSVAIIGFGASIAIYLPLTPFIIFFGTFLGWTVLVAEAIIAAPIWAITHLSPTGNDFMGSAKNGYMMILSLMLRPAFAVIGFVAAVLLMDPIIMFFHKVYFPVFTNAIGGSVMGLVTWIVLIVLYFSFMVSLFHKGFSLIHRIPDELLRWFGGGGGQLGEYGGHADQEGKRIVGGVVGGFMGSAANTFANQSANAAIKSGQEKMQQRGEMRDSLNALDSSGDKLSKALMMSKNASSGAETAKAAALWEDGQKETHSNALKNASNMLSSKATGEAYMKQFESMYPNGGSDGIRAAWESGDHGQLAKAIEATEVANKTNGENIGAYAGVGSKTQQIMAASAALQPSAAQVGTFVSEAKTSLGEAGFSADGKSFNAPASFTSEDERAKALNRFDNASEKIASARSSATAIGTGFNELCAEARDSNLSPALQEQLAGSAERYCGRALAGLPDASAMEAARSAILSAPIVAPNSGSGEMAGPADPPAPPDAG